MTDRPNPTPPDPPYADGFDVKLYRLALLLRAQEERGGYGKQQREAKGKTQIQLWYRDLALERHKRRETEYKEKTDNE